MDTQLLAEMIREARGGRSQEEFGRQLGVSQTAVRNWESGRTEPSLNNLSAIAAACGGKSLLQFLTEVIGEGMVEQPKPRTAEDIFYLINYLDKGEQNRLLHMIIDALFER